MLLLTQQTIIRYPLLFSQETAETIFFNRCMAHFFLKLTCSLKRIHHVGCEAGDIAFFIWKLEKSCQQDISGERELNKYLKTGKGWKKLILLILKQSRWKKFYWLTLFLFILLKQTVTIESRIHYIFIYKVSELLSN